jgi:hypothetical protein
LTSDETAFAQTFAWVVVCEARLCVGEANRHRPLLTNYLTTGKERDSSRKATPVMARPTLTAAFRKAALDFPGRNLAILVNLS